jgi:hypothetical protein
MVDVVGVYAAALIINFTGAAGAPIGRILALER